MVKVPASSLCKRKNVEVDDNNSEASQKKIIKLENSNELNPELEKSDADLTNSDNEVKSENKEDWENEADGANGADDDNGAGWGNEADDESGADGENGADWENEASESDSQDCDRIQELESHISDLYEFIINERILHRAPIKIQELINLDFASRDFYEKSIRAGIDEESNAFHNSNRSSNFSKLTEFIKDVEQLSHMSQGLPLAFGLAFYLCGSTFREDSKIVNASRYECFPFDCLAYNLCLRMKDENPYFDPKVYLTRVDEQRQWVRPDSDGLVPHLLQCSDLLRSLVEGPSYIQLSYNNMLNNIRKAYEDGVNFLSTNPPGNAASVLSSHMLKQIPHLQRLTYMAGGKKMAFDLVLFMGRHSHLNDPANSRGHQVTEEFNKAADSMLLKISKAIREEDPTFRPVNAMEILLEEIETIETTEYGGCFPQSYKLFLSWMPEVEKAHVQHDYDDLRTKISNAHATIKRRLEVFVKDETRPTTDLLGKKMSGFIVDIDRLSKKMGGLIPAINLTIFLGECSYTNMEGLGPLYGWESKDKFHCKREFDPVGDDCLRALLERVRDEDISMDEVNYDRMERSIEYLKSYGITTYFPSSYNLLSQLCG
ncbi:hypothetical protein NHQ30_008764 [Ciborinia camelliae]|nr:hypothetical protein NHQ30_008764 [Ciborinia camelliae]